MLQSRGTTLTPQVRIRAVVAIMVLAFLAFLPGVGEAVNTGESLTQGEFTLDITPEVSGGGDPVVRIRSVTGTGKLRDGKLVTLPYAQPMTVEVSRNTSRILIEVDLPVASSAQIRIQQGTTVITHDCSVECRLLFDVIPAP